MSWLFRRAFVIACSTKEATARRSRKDFYPLWRELRHCLIGAVRISRHDADGATGRGKVDDALPRAAAGKLRRGTCVHNATSRGIGPDCVGRNRRLCNRSGLCLSVVFPLVFSAAGKEGLAALNGVAIMTCPGALMGPPTVSSILHNFCIQVETGFVAMFSMSIPVAACRSAMLIKPPSLAARRPADAKTTSRRTAGYRLRRNQRTPKS